MSRTTEACGGGHANLYAAFIPTRFTFGLTERVAVNNVVSLYAIYSP